MELDAFYRLYCKEFGEKFKKEDLTLNGEICTDDELFTKYFSRQITIRLNMFGNKVVQLNISANIRNLLSNNCIHNLGAETRDTYCFIFHLRDIVVGHDGGIFVVRLENLYEVIFSGKRFQTHTNRFDLEYLLGQIPGLEIFTTKINKLNICRIMGGISRDTHPQFSPAVKKYFSEQKSVHQSEQLQSLLMNVTDDEFNNITQDDLGPLFELFYKKPMKSIDSKRKFEIIEHTKLKRAKQIEVNSQLCSETVSLPNSCGISNSSYTPYFRGDEDLYVIHHRRHNTTQENIEQHVKSQET